MFILKTTPKFPAAIYVAPKHAIRQFDGEPDYRIFTTLIFSCSLSTLRGRWNEYQASFGTERRGSRVRLTTLPGHMLYSTSGLKVRKTGMGTTSSDASYIVQPQNWIFFKFYKTWNNEKNFLVHSLLRHGTRIKRNAFSYNYKY